MKLSVGEMDMLVKLSMGEISVGEFSVGEFSMGEFSMDEFSYGQCGSTYSNCWSRGHGFCTALGNSSAALKYIKLGMGYCRTSSPNKDLNNLPTYGDISFLTT